MLCVVRCNLCALHFVLTCSLILFLFLSKDKRSQSKPVAQVIPSPKRLPYICRHQGGGGIYGFCSSWLLSYIGKITDTPFAIQPNSKVSYGKARPSPLRRKQLAGRWRPIRGCRDIKLKKKSVPFRFSQLRLPEGSRTPDLKLKPKSVGIQDADQAMLRSNGRPQPAGDWTLLVQP